MKRVYLNDNVLEAAIKRIRRIFLEFDTVVVNISGGKDSTVVYHLALQVAEELGRLPLPVLFIDQEAEWEMVIEYVRELMADPRVTPYWLQIPMRIFNATSTNEEDAWLKCWEPNADWIRPKEPNSIHENTFGTDRFARLFDETPKVFWPGRKVASLAGVRTEESPGRLAGLTNVASYKDITWCKKGKHQYAFYPLYDWSWMDVWKAIHEHQWPYCPLYDYMYQYGVLVKDMRVSNVHHETATNTLHFLQEIEPETWNKIVARVNGVHAVGRLSEAYRTPDELPPMFQSWKEYRDHLLANLIQSPEHQEIFRKRFASEDRRFVSNKITHKLVRMQIDSLLLNDYHGTKSSNFHAKWHKYGINAGKKYHERT